MGQVITPLQLINSLKETDEYIETIFTRGGCYRFYLFLKSIWPDAIPVINQSRDHVGALIGGEAYDINGLVDWAYRAMDDEDIELASNWTFAGNMFLSLGECPICEEPLLVGPEG